MKDLQNTIWKLKEGATVIGYGDEYTNCSIELTAKGWKVCWTELYVWDEEDETYYAQ